MPVVDRQAWADRLKRISAIARDSPLLYSSRAAFSHEVQNRVQVTSEGTRLQTHSTRLQALDVNFYRDPELWP